MGSCGSDAEIRHLTGKAESAIRPLETRRSDEPSGTQPFNGPVSFSLSPKPESRPALLSFCFIGSVKQILFTGAVAC